MQTIQNSVLDDIRQKPVDLEHGEPPSHTHPDGRRSNSSKMLDEEFDVRFERALLTRLDLGFALSKRMSPFDPHSTYSKLES